MIRWTGSESARLGPWRLQPDRVHCSPLGTATREDIECPSRVTRFFSECSSTPRPATGSEIEARLPIRGSASQNHYRTLSYPFCQAESARKIPRRFIDS